MRNTISLFRGSLSNTYTTSLKSEYARAKLGMPYWSLSAYLKGKVKKALTFVTDFENAVAHEAKKRGYQGVVCGHIHKAEIRMIDDILYCNDGDWVESRSALVEHMDGTLELVYWDQVIDFLPVKQLLREPAELVT